MNWFRVWGRLVCVSGDHYPRCILWGGNARLQWAAHWRKISAAQQREAASRPALALVLILWLQLCLGYDVCMWQVTEVWRTKVMQTGWGHCPHFYSAGWIRSSNYGGVAKTLLCFRNAYRFRPTLNTKVSARVACYNSGEDAVRLPKMLKKVGWQLSAFPCFPQYSILSAGREDVEAFPHACDRVWLVIPESNAHSHYVRQDVLWLSARNERLHIQMVRAGCNLHAKTPVSLINQLEVGRKATEGSQ